MKSLDYTTGKISGLLLKTAVPMLLASLVNMITQMANVFFMGHTGQDVLYVLSLYIPISFLLIALVEALQLSTQVTISRNRGKNQTEISSLLAHYAAGGLLLTIAVGLIVILCVPLFRYYYGIADSVHPLFSGYVRGMMIAAIPAVLGAIANAALRGLGMAQQASIIAVGTAAVNVLLVYLLVRVIGLSLSGIVYANMISGLLSLAAAFIYLIRTGHLKLPPRVWRMSQLILLRHVGVPVFVSYCLIFLSTLFYNGIISPYGESVIAGFGVGYRIQTMAILPGIVIGSAIGIIINQNMAEKKGERAYEGFKTGMRHSYAAYVLIAAGVWLFKDSIVSFLIVEEAARQEAAQYLSIVAPSYILMGPLMTALLTMEQTGQGYRALLLNSVYFILIVTAGFGMTSLLDQPEAFYWCIFFANLAGASVIIPTFRMYKKRYVQAASDPDHRAQEKVFSPQA